MKVKLLKVKPLKQSPSFCGPVCLKMVLAYYGVQKSEKGLARACKTTQEYGTTSTGVVRGSRKIGFKATLRWRSSFSDIAKLLKNNVPPIVNWFSVDDVHYSVVIGLDKKYVYIVDPEIGRRRKIERKKFLPLWFDRMGDNPAKYRKIVPRPLIAVYPLLPF